MRNGLYSIHADLLDGRSGKGSGVAVFRNGEILGGDAYLYYVGTYTFSGDTFKGALQVMQHTRSAEANPLFGGQSQPVGMGISGTFTETSATMNGTALVGKASQLFRATLRRLADAD